jgi:hypothetical protein
MPHIWLPSSRYENQINIGLIDDKIEMRERINMKIKISATVIAVSLLLMLSLSACLNFPLTADRGAEACYRQLNTGLDHLGRKCHAVHILILELVAFISLVYLFCAGRPPGLPLES